MSNPLVRILAVVDDSVAMLERIALAAGVLGMTLVNVANVIMRNFFDASLAFANEISFAEAQRIDGMTPAGLALILASLQNRSDEAARGAA